MSSITYLKRDCFRFLTLLVLISLFLNPTMIIAENKVTLDLGTASALPGSEVDIPIIINHNTGIASLKLLIKYDDTALTLTNVTFPKNTGTYSSVPQPYAAEQIINFVSPLSSFTKTGTFATLSFSVSEDVNVNEIKSIVVEYVEEDVFDMNFNSVPLIATNGAVYISDGSQDSMAVLPSALTMITEESFMNTSFYYVVLPETITKIESKAFAECNNLKYIYIPENTTAIADDAFLNVTNLTVYGKSGSYAEFFAGKKGYIFKVR